MHASQLLHKFNQAHVGSSASLPVSASLVNRDSLLKGQSGLPSKTSVTTSCTLLPEHAFHNLCRVTQNRTAMAALAQQSKCIYNCGPQVVILRAWHQKRWLLPYPHQGLCACCLVHQKLAWHKAMIHPLALPGATSQAAWLVAATSSIAQPLLRQAIQRQRAPGSTKNKLSLSAHGIRDGCCRLAYVRARCACVWVHGRGACASLGVRHTVGLAGCSTHNDARGQPAK
jgi:hypothetical protein